ncbi:Lipase 2 [Nocardia africana]|uniref:Lipase 2 n=1 Tax=Nocardia africana TaxID=134964 RepID=A0A378WWX0_9NOCA|nr:Lipase 2 [Nocardia africana]
MIAAPSPRTLGSDLVSGPIARLRDHRHFHPDLRPYALVLPRESIGPRTLPIMRRIAARIRPHPAARVIDLDRGVRVRVFGTTDDQAPGPALLWIHGGGYVFGTAAQDDRWCHQIATRTGVLVASVDYRLAPEHPYPAALHDCHLALTWLASRPGVDPGRIILAGASAGGGLAAALAAHTLDHGPVIPVQQLLFYPMLDHTHCLTPAPGIDCGDRAATPSPGTAISRAPIPPTRCPLIAAISPDSPRRGSPSAISTCSTTRMFATTGP